jgi:hypothetical protein
MIVSRYTWEKLLIRWSGLQPIPEVKLLAAIAASMIAPEAGEAKLPKDFRNSVQWRRVFDAYIHMLHLEPDFVLDQMDRALQFSKRNAHVAEDVCQ